MEAVTYILTAEMDAESFGWLDGLRRQNFPPERNQLPAHLTLFHRLSSAQVSRMKSVDQPSTPVGIRFNAIGFLGFGVAIQVHSVGLRQLRNNIRDTVGGELSRQDLQPWKPHVTIQNKVPAEIAKQLKQRLEKEFVERAGIATGLLIWEYLGGPWKLAERLPFGSP